MVDVVVKGILNLSIILNTTARDSSTGSFVIPRASLSEFCSFTCGNLCKRKQAEKS